ncbi:nodulation protein H-like [Trifolium pratense]|uniref:Nodulation protein H-like n=1 Tax=Trifolium pratense TaxID=57577 RepID=A0A2K3P3M2_TRIPR|nr:nodulation protein H-like [Trifolium pratense]
MADDLPTFTKDVLLVKGLKNSTLVWRLVVLAFAMVVQKPCPEPNIEPWEIPYVHYPNPKTYSREECSCHPVRYFTILSMQRSGSGWFETFLNSHPNISSNGEIFSVKVRRSNMTTITETLDTIYNLDWVSSASKNECTAAVGLKWMLNQVFMFVYRKNKVIL